MCSQVRMLKFLEPSRERIMSQTPKIIYFKLLMHLHLGQSNMTTIFDLDLETWLLFRKRGERFFLPTPKGPTHWRNKIPIHLMFLETYSCKSGKGEMFHVFLDCLICFDALTPQTMDICVVIVPSQIQLKCNLAKLLLSKV